jgi:anaerobic selenocysteine-containing dehydrogenase
MFNRQAQANLFPDAILEGRPYPLRGLVLVGANPLVTSPGARRLRRAYEKLDLLVTVDPFMTETGEASHFVLPAATFAEAAGVGTDERVMPEPLVPPQHQAWPDWKILFELARACGLGRYFPWPSLKEAMEAPASPYMLDPPHQPHPERPPGDRRAPPVYPTLSGKIELRSGILARFGIDPLPRWTPPRQAPSREFPWILVSGPRTRVYINSQFREIPSVASKLPRPFAEIPPQVAEPLGIQTGDRVVVVSPHGRIELPALVTDRVHPETVVLGGGWARANANLLIDGEALDPISGFPAFRSAVCRVEKASPGRRGRTARSAGRSGAS